MLCSVVLQAVHELLQLVHSKRLATQLPWVTTFAMHSFSIQRIRKGGVLARGAKRAEEAAAQTSPMTMLLHFAMVNMVARKPKMLLLLH